jgi:prevent-host-death family protein
MKTVNIAEAKATLSELVRLASAGETITIAQRGKPVAQIVPLTTEKTPIDVEAWRIIAEAAGLQPEDAGTLVRRMRDDERY